MAKFKSGFFAGNLYFSVVHHNRLAERSPADRDRLAAYGIVNQFVDAHDGDRIRPGLTMDGDANHPFVGMEQFVAVGDGAQPRVGENRKGIPCHSPHGVGEVLLLDFLFGTVLGIAVPNKDETSNISDEKY